MLKAFVYSITCIFAMYGFFHLVLRFLQYHLFDSTEIIKSPYTVLCVKNQADTIESTIRSTAWHMLSQNRTREVSDIIIIDLGSTDETFNILINLAKEYEFLHPMHKEQYIELVGSM